MSRVAELEAELAMAIAEEAFVAAKAGRGDAKGEKKYEEALASVTAARIRYRVAQNRPGSDRFRVAEDGTVYSVRERVVKTPVRDDKGNKIGYEESVETVEAVIGR